MVDIVEIPKKGSPSSLDSSSPKSSDSRSITLTSTRVINPYTSKKKTFPSSSKEQITNEGNLNKSNEIDLPFSSELSKVEMEFDNGCISSGDSSKSSTSDSSDDSSSSSTKSNYSCHLDYDNKHIGRNRKSKDNNSETNNIDNDTINNTDVNNANNNTKFHSLHLSAFPKRSKPIIDPLSYKPPIHEKNKPDPIIHTHKLTLQNRPLSTRKMVPVSTVFHKPISNFWNSKWHSFNHMQSEISQTLVYSDDNVVVSAPTGAGKTCVFEMAMGRLFQSEFKYSERRQYSNKTNNPKLPNFRKIVYLSPSKALCQERFQDWSKRLTQVDDTIQCTILTGDSNSNENYGSVRDVASAHVILTTPEKWDSITRKWTDNLYLIGSVKLLLIDEVHLIGDSSRGGCLETIICRMKTVQRAAKAQQNYNLHYTDEEKQSSSTLQEALSSNMRLVAVSATLPNIEDIASFLDAHEAYCFDSSYRPVPLTTHVVGLGYIGKNQFLFDKGLNRHVPDLVKRFSNGRPSIIFCHTKKQTEILAAELSSSIGNENDSMLSSIAQKVNLRSLKNCLLKGIAFHHAGLENENRQLVEQFFSKGLIKCLCATSTLAMGVNLPAQLVIIKGTSVWRGAGQGYQQIDNGTLLQMMGRAGRPGLDNTGTAVIMTDAKSKLQYERMSHGLETVESMLLKQLTETLNTEISQRVIRNTKEAIDWLKGTFFYKRVRKNTKYYGLQRKKDEEIESYLMTLCVNSLQKLHETNIVELDCMGKTFQPRNASHVMSRHMIPFDDMKTIIALPHDAGALQLLNALSEMDGIHFPVRRSEKLHLNEVHKLVKYKLQEGPPSKIRIQTPSQKAFVLLQAAIGQNFLDDYTLRQEMSLSIEYASRVLTAAEDYSVEESKHGQVALESLILRRCLATSLWGASDGVLNQLRGVGAKTAAKLAMNKIRTFDDILSKSSNEIEQACGRKSPFGQELKKVVSKISSKSLRLSGHIEGLESKKEPNELVCHLLSNDESSDVNGVSGDEESRIVTYTLAVHTDRPGGSLMFRTELNGPSSHRIRCPAKFGRIYIRLVSNLVGLDQQLILEGNDIVKKSAFTLSPLNIKIKVKPKATNKKVKKRDMSKSHESMVNGVDDFRMSKGNLKQARGKCVTTPASRKTNAQCEVTEMRLSPFHDRKEPLVTPSPQPVLRAKFSRPEPKYETSSFVSKSESSSFTSQMNSFPFEPQVHRSPLVSKHNEQFRRERATIRDPKRCRNQHSSWKMQRKKQQQFQKRAFGSPKENPFSKFRFDPNCVERQLEMESKSSSERKLENASIISPNKNISTNKSNMFHLERRSRFLSNSIGVTKTPSKLLNTKLIGSIRRRRVGTPYQYRNSELLRKKAIEQQTYASFQQKHYAPTTGGILQHQELTESSPYPSSGGQFHGDMNKNNSMESKYNDYHPPIRLSSQPSNTGLLLSDDSFCDTRGEGINYEYMEGASPMGMLNIDPQGLIQNNLPQDVFLGFEDNQQLCMPIHNSSTQIGHAPSEITQDKGCFFNPNGNVECIEASLPVPQQMSHGHNYHSNFPSINDSALQNSFDQNMNVEGMVIRVNNSNNDDHNQNRSTNNDEFESAFF